MTETLGTLFQTNPGAASLTDAYTTIAPTVLSGIWVCNRSVATSFRVSIAPAAAANDNKQYIAYDQPINANETIKLGEGATLATGTVIRVYATLATLSFNGFGSVLST